MCVGAAEHTGNLLVRALSEGIFGDRLAPLAPLSAALDALHRWLAITYADTRTDAEELTRRKLCAELCAAGLAVERDPSPHPLDGDPDRMWPLGPEVRPGATVRRCVHFPSDRHEVVSVLAVAQTAEQRIVYVRFASDPWFGDGQHLGRMVWTKRIGDRGWTWGVTHARSWEGPRTLDEALADIVELNGPMEVLR
jgi:hypothetical protein